MPAPTTSSTYQIACIRNQVEHTKTRLAHWKTQANECDTHRARIEAGALVLLYESQLRTLRAKLAALQSTPATA